MSFQLSLTELCDLCGDYFPIREIHFTGKQFLCRRCRIMEDVNTILESIHEGHPKPWYADTFNSRLIDIRDSKGECVFCERLSDYHPDFRKVTEDIARLLLALSKTP